MAGEDAFGTQFQRGDGGGPEVFTTIASVTKISPPSPKRDTADVTAHDSPNGYKEVIGLLREGGEVTIEINFRPSVHGVLLADLDDELPRSYRVIFPDPTTTTWDFKAVMTGFENDAPHDGKLTGKVTFQISGKPTLS